MGSCAQAPDGTESSQAKMETGSGKVLGMPSAMRGTCQAQNGLELSGDQLPGEGMGPTWAGGLVLTHPEGASLDLLRQPSA